MPRVRAPGVRSAKLPSVILTQSVLEIYHLLNIFTAADDIPHQLWSKILHAATEPE